MDGRTTLKEWNFPNNAKIFKKVIKSVAVSDRDSAFCLFLIG